MKLPKLLCIALAASGLASIPADARVRMVSKPREAIADVLAQQLRRDFTKHTRAEMLAAIESADINGDGIEDYAVNFTNFGPAWCGTGGCRYQLWAGRRNGPPVRVFDRQMRELSIVRRGERIVYVFDFHGSECGGFGSELCPGGFAWSAKKGRLVLLPTPAKHTRLINPIQPQ